MYKKSLSYIKISTSSMNNESEGPRFITTFQFDTHVFQDVAILYFPNTVLNRNDE